MIGHGSWCSPDCFGCKVKSLSISATVFASGNAGAARVMEVVNMEKRWDKDLPAYKRLRKQGYQPKSTEGAAALERDATSRFEIESGRISSDPKKLASALRQFEDGTGKDVFTPITKAVA
jgi:hypothetical protein